MSRPRKYKEDPTASAHDWRGIYRRPGSKWLWIHFQHDGIQRHECTRTVERAEAHKILLDRRAGVGVKPKRTHQIGPASGVYFLKSKVTGLVKIGCSTNVHRRVHEIRAYAGDQDLEFSGFIWASQPRVLEASIHRELQGFREHGEWFRIDAETTIKDLARRFGAGQGMQVFQL